MVEEVYAASEDDQTAAPDEVGEATDAEAQAEEVSSNEANPVEASNEKIDEAAEQDGKIAEVKVDKDDAKQTEAVAEEVNTAKLNFLTEQLRLLKGNNQSNRFSTSFLWAAITWQKTSPALYKLLREDGLMTLPSISYLKQLSSSFSLSSGLSSSAVAYLEERLKTLSPKERIVALAIDEVSIAKFELKLLLRGFPSFTHPLLDNLLTHPMRILASSG